MRSSSLLLAAFLVTTACTTQNNAPVETNPSTETITVATVNGAVITMDELDAEITSELHELRNETLQRMVMTRVVDAAAEKEGKTAEELVLSRADEKVGQVGEAEVMEFLKQRQPLEAGKEYPAEMIESATKYLQDQRRQGAIREVVTALMDTAEVEITLEAPRVEVAATGFAKGPENAPITIVEFSDFECPYCSKARTTIDELVANNEGKIRLVFRDFPLPFHKKAQKAAEAARCAGQQDQFWGMHDWMFDNQKSLDEESLLAAATTLKLDADKFSTCLTSGATAKDVTADMEAGKKVGVSGTPAFFINGISMSGAVPLSDLQALVDKELAASAKK